MGYKQPKLSQKDEQIEQLKQQLQEANTQITSYMSSIDSYKESISLMQAGECNKLSAEGERLREEILQLQEQKAFAQLEMDNMTNILRQLKDTNEQEEEKLREVTDMMRARVAALQREQNIKENLSDYCLSINAEDKSDIEMLENLKPRLHKPRILSMLIWQTYFQKQLTTLCNQIFGTKTVTGIYKITNVLDNYCYIGQAANVSDRIKEHVKCGLGIDTPAGNKLYDAMQKDGVYNFAFELLEECPRTSLNEKEKEYIEIYDSYNLGYNSNRGISK